MSKRVCVAFISASFFLGLLLGGEISYFEPVIPQHMILGGQDDPPYESLLTENQWSFFVDGEPNYTDFSATITWFDGEVDDYEYFVDEDWWDKALENS